MTVRKEQITLCHFMIDSMQRRRIALCDAGTGIGKTYAYLTAAVLFRSCRPSRRAQAITISTATVALQEAICREYLPFLSRVLLKNRMIDRPLYAAVRKGKERFVCDIRLARRLEAVWEKEKNEKQFKALLSLRGKLDLDQLPELSGFDRRQVCVPAHCPANCPGARNCRYHRYLWEVSRCESMIQICNHNYLLADAVHRLEGRRPLLNDSQLLIVDEAHRLPEATRQMCACSVSTTDLTELCSLSEREHLPGSQALRGSVQELTHSLTEPARRSPCTAFLLTAERKEALQSTISLLKQLLAERRTLPFSLHYRLEETEQLLSIFYRRDKHYVLTLRSHRDGSFQLRANVRDTPAQLRHLLWEQEIPAVLTSGTLMTGGSFERTRRSLGISCRFEETKAASPFPYQENCLLYFPANPTAARFGSREEADWIAEQILVSGDCGKRAHAGAVPFLLFDERRSPPSQRKAVCSDHGGMASWAGCYSSVQAVWQRGAVRIRLLLGRRRFSGRYGLLAHPAAPPLLCPRSSERGGAGTISHAEGLYPRGRCPGDAEKAPAGLRARNPDGNGHLRGEYP